MNGDEGDAGRIHGGIRGRTDRNVRRPIGFDQSIRGGCDTGARSGIRDFCRPYSSDPSLRRASAGAQTPMYEAGTTASVRADPSINSNGVRIMSRKADSVQSSNPVKEPDEWTTGDEPMTGPLLSAYARAAGRRAGRGFSGLETTKGDADRVPLRHSPAPPQTLMDSGRCIPGRADCYSPGSESGGSRPFRIVLP